MAITKYQKFEVKTINRKDINNAPYNPRKISDKAKDKLKKNIKERGFMGGIVVNKTNMNLISGHQRLLVLDSLERKQDYEITVNLVELSEKEEKEQNIFFNNLNAQGEFDELLLKDIFNDIDYEFTGFEESDLAAFNITINEFQNNSDEVKNIQNIKEKLNKIRKENVEKLNKENDTNFFISLIFETVEDKINFCKKYNLNITEQYIKFEDFLRLIK